MSNKLYDETSLLEEMLNAGSLEITITTFPHLNHTCFVASAATVNFDISIN